MEGNSWENVSRAAGCLDFEDFKASGHMPPKKYYHSCHATEITFLHQSLWVAGKNFYSKHHPNS